MNDKIINNDEEALEYINTKLRQAWVESLKSHDMDEDLGEAKIIENSVVNDHTAWSYYIEGIPLSMEARKRWLLDTGEVVDTKMGDSTDTLDKVFDKRRPISGDIMVTNY